MHLDDVHAHGEWEAMDEIYKKYDHPLWQNYDPAATDGHGGMDFLVMSAFAEAARTKTPPPIDVYDVAAWMAVTCLSEQSIALGSAPMAFPDFTNGKWIRREPSPKNRWNLDEIYDECYDI